MIKYLDWEAVEKEPEQIIFGKDILAEKLKHFFKENYFSDSKECQPRMGRDGRIAELVLNYYKMCHGEFDSFETGFIVEGKNKKHGILVFDKKYAKLDSFFEEFFEMIYSLIENPVECYNYVYHVFHYFVVYFSFHLPANFAKNETDAAVRELTDLVFASFPLELRLGISI